MRQYDYTRIGMVGSYIIVLFGQCGILVGRIGGYSHCLDFSTSHSQYFAQGSKQQCDKMDEYHCFFHGLYRHGNVNVYNITFMEVWCRTAMNVPIYMYIYTGLSVTMLTTQKMRLSNETVIYSNI